MPETRYIEEYENGILVNQIPYEVSDEELADEAEAEGIKLVIERLPDAGINKAWKRLIKKGILP